MAVFLRRFMGALVLDPSAFEDIEADRTALLQSLLVVAIAAAAGGTAAVGLGLIGVAGFLAGAIVVLGAWLVWIMTVSVLGTASLAEPQTRSSVPELIRTLGFAMAPGAFLAFAAMRAVAPLVLILVVAWIVAATVMAMRQALDYRSTTRAVIVCVVGWLLAIGVVATIAAMFSTDIH